MKRIAIVTIISVLLFGPVLALAADSAKELENEKIVIIVNGKSTLAGSLTKQRIKDIYLGNEKFEGGMRIYPMGQQDDELLKLFLEKYIGMTLSEYQYYWVGKTFTDGVSAPKLIDGSHEIVKNVWTYVGGIGFMWAADLTEKEKELVTVVTLTK
jgi:hypothetical protein